MSDKSKIEWTDATWNSIWSARTCPRFGRTRRAASQKAASSRRSPNLKVVFFLKQWGGVRKAQAGLELDGETYDEFPECRQNAVPHLQFRRNALEQLEVQLV
jgi:protein gp37